MTLFSEPGPRVFSVPPGLPLGRAVAEGTLERLRAVGGQPFDLTDVEIVVSTERGARVLRSAFIEAAGGAVIGPRIRVLTKLDEIAGAALDAPDAIDKTRRRLYLARLVRMLLAAKPELAAPIAAAALAADLDGFLESMQTEGVPLDRLDSLTTEEQAQHWALSKAFLDIVRGSWPGILADENKIDQAERNRLAVEALAERWDASPPTHPVIIAGSTGSREVSAQFIELVAGLPQGVVILPGLDTEMDARTEAALRDGVAPEHPQAGLIALLKRIGVSPSDVGSWREDTRAHARARLRVLGQAMRPPPVTDVWRDAAETLKDDALPATAGLTLIEAAGPREEAAAIALALREAMETPGKRAALITRDRNLARRVSAELKRWDINADDSGGRPLKLTPPGVFLTLVAEAALDGFKPASVLALIKHPLCAIALPGDGRDGREIRGAHLRRVRWFERRVLRNQWPGPGLEGLRRAIGLAARKSEDIQPYLDWFDALSAPLAEFAKFAEDASAPLAALVAAHKDAADALSFEQTPGELELYRKKAGETLHEFLAKFSLNAAAFGEIDPREYLALLSQMIGGESVREPYGQHPRIVILGTLEARTEPAELVILGGLNDGVWPDIPQPDPWISRTMRAALGLPPLESRIGLSAHDFFQAAMAETAILTRTRMKDGSPTVPARWLRRLNILLGGVSPDALAQMRARGARWLRLGHARDEPRPGETLPTPAVRPEPRPPVEARPTQFSVTEVETLIRDPYAVYARKVLRLRPLNDLEEEPDARDRGEILHQICEQFVRETLTEWPADPKARFEAVAEDVLSRVGDWPTLHAFWLARAHQMRDWFLETEHARRTDGRPAALEASGEYRFPAALGEVGLTAKADRIDRLKNGAYAIYDYKSGRAPSEKQIDLFAKQLPLEAAILAYAGFEGAPQATVSKLAFLELSGGRRGGEERVLQEDAMKLGDDALEGFGKLMGAYANPDTPYRSRTRPQFLIYDGEYDHLARVGEWGGGGRSDGGGEG
ncbi:MAG: double-strand break repair protein AddB [Neomegalonema sp.]